jgi:hypothetical protein
MILREAFHISEPVQLYAPAEVEEPPKLELENRPAPIEQPQPKQTETFTASPEFTAWLLVAFFVGCFVIGVIVWMVLIHMRQQEILHLLRLMK